MDDPAALAAEWERKNVVPALRDLYDEIWIYGLPQINKPLTGIEVPPSVRHKMFYTGYLHRDLPLHSDMPHEMEEIDGPFILVTAGGGGDGADLIDWVLAAYESDPHIPYGAVIVFGPFMSATEREAFKERAAKFRNIRTLTFTNNLGALMQRAAGVVAMGGYNTFCEILSFDKKAIIVPRTRPRLEQFIRARAARNVGLLEMLDADRGRDPHAMATALRQLPQQGLPSDVVVPGLLDGAGQRPAPGRQAARPSSSRSRGARIAGSELRRAPAVAAGRAAGARQDLITGRFMSSPIGDARVAVVLKGWPRLSETFIAQEIAGLEARGVALEIWSLRRPTDKARHPVHDRVAGRAVYLPEYLKDDPRRVLRGWRKARRLPGYAGGARANSSPTCGAIPTSNRLRRWGQALVLAAELPPVDRAALRPLPAHAVLGDALRRHDARPAVERVGARQGHLDQRTVGGGGKARRLLLAGDLHGPGPAAAAGAGAATGTAEARLSRPRLRPSAAAAGGAAAARRQRPRRSRRHPVDRPQGREEGLRRSPGRAGPAAARRSTGASSMSAAASSAML